jgi:phenylacetate-coenzyme A ligase PaaK-like adenylate-forming protein
VRRSILWQSYAWLRVLWEHSRTARLTRAQLKARQAAKFRRLVRFAQSRSPFYQSIIRQHGIDPNSCGPEDFPVLTKKDVIERFDEIVTDPRITLDGIADFLSRSSDPNDLFANEYHVVHTSGTSGTVGYFVFSREAWIRGCSHIARISPPRFRKRTAFVAATRGHFAGASLVLTARSGTNNLFYDVRTYDVNRPMSEIAAALNAFQPQTLSGYASVLDRLAEAQSRGELRIRPALVVNGGEPLFGELRSHLATVFKAPVANTYASSEHLFMAMTLPDCDGMHLLEDDLMFELHDNHTCVTNLFNDVMPLIRYRMDDVLVPVFEGSSRYPFTKIREVIGRIDDAPVFANQHGEQDFIHPSLIEEFLASGLRSWQVVLLDNVSFVFRARFKAGSSQQDKQATRRQIRQKLAAILAEKQMENVRFEIEEVDSFPVDPATGKFRLVVPAQPAARR